MISAEDVRKVVEEYISTTDMFLVDVIVNSGNTIVVEVDRMEGMDIDSCVALNRHIESVFDRETEDYELEVGSAGLTTPFKVLQQYEKNIGNEVEVLSKEGKKYAGELSEVDQDHFVILREVKKAIEGSKKKQLVEEQISFSYSEIKYCKYNMKI